MPSADATERRIPDVRVNSARAAVVECVEGFEAELQSCSLREFYVLDQGDVPQLQPRSQHGPRFLSAEVTDRCGERCGIEELSRSLWTVGIANQVGADLS